MVDCILLAGGGDSDLTRQEEVSNKALLKIEGKEMIWYVLNSFRKLEEIERIVLVGPEAELGYLKGEFSIEIIPGEGSIMQNIVAGNRQLKTNRHVLISSSDIPLVTPGAVRDFLAKCHPFDYDFYYPIVTRESSEKQFPGVRRTYVTLREGTFTGGNIFLVNPAMIEPSAPVIEKFLEERKNPLKMVRLLGPGFLLLFLSKRMTLRRLEKRFSQLLSLKAKAIISEYPALSFDVDKPDDLELARRIFGERERTKEEG